MLNSCLCNICAILNRWKYIYSILIPISTTCTNSDLFVYNGTTFECNSNNECYIYNNSYISYVIKWNECSTKNETYIATNDAESKLKEIYNSNGTECRYSRISPCSLITYSVLAPALTLVAFNICIFGGIFFTIRAHGNLVNI